MPFLSLRLNSGVREISDTVNNSLREMNKPGSANLNTTGDLSCLLFYARSEAYYFRVTFARASCF